MFGSRAYGTASAQNGGAAGRPLALDRQLGLDERGGAEERGQLSARLCLRDREHGLQRVAEALRLFVLGAAAGALLTMTCDARRLSSGIFGVLQYSKCCPGTFPDYAVGRSSGVSPIALHAYEVAAVDTGS